MQSVAGFGFRRPIERLWTDHLMIAQGDWQRKFSGSRRSSCWQMHVRETKRDSREAQATNNAKQDESRYCRSCFNAEDGGETSAQGGVASRLCLDATGRVTTLRIGAGTLAAAETRSLIGSLDALP